MNTHYTYFIILAVSVAGPLALSFDKKVAFYTKWKFVFPAMIIPALFYIGWDIFFTAKGVWSFNEDYITGIKLYNLPVEEVLFFFIVPYCCVFIYECINCYFPQLKSKSSGEIVLKFTGMLLFIAGIVFYKKYYTGWTFIFNAIFIAVILSEKKYFENFKATVFAVAYCIILIPFLVVNGFLTAIPVVLYNDSENLGLRIYTIPFEDVFYGMLLILMNIVIYENLRSGRKPTKLV